MLIFYFFCSFDQFKLFVKNVLQDDIPLTIIVELFSSENLTVLVPKNWTEDDFLQGIGEYNKNISKNLDAAGVPKKINPINYPLNRIYWKDSIITSYKDVKN